MAPHHQGRVPRRAGSEARGTDCDAAASAMVSCDGVALALTTAAAAAGFFVAFAFALVAFALAVSRALALAVALAFASADTVPAFPVVLGDAPEPACAPEPVVAWVDGVGAGLGLGFGLGFGDEVVHLLAAPGAAPQSKRQPSTEPGVGL